MQTIDLLNQRFAITDRLYFTEEEGGFIIANIKTDVATARVSTYAAQVLSYKLRDDDRDLVFLSDKAVYQQGKAIRGGIPVCWPWFGDDTSGLSRPSHGFMRNQQWTVLQAALDNQGRVTITLGFEATDDTKELWPYDFELRLEIIVGDTLELKLITHNTSSEAVTISQALHTYFNISDPENIVVKGLKNKIYLDKLADFSEKLQRNDVVITQETDRIFQAVNNEIQLVDTGFNRVVTIFASGSETSVIWNPWTTAISAITDLNKLDYQRFLCVETANAANDTVTIAAGQSHCMSVIYRINIGT